MSSNRQQQRHHHHHHHQQQQQQQPSKKRKHVTGLDLCKSSLCAADLTAIFDKLQQQPPANANDDDDSFTAATTAMAKRRRRRPKEITMTRLRTVSREQRLLRAAHGLSAILNELPPKEAPQFLNLSQNPRLGGGGRRRSSIWQNDQDESSNHNRSSLPCAMTVLTQRMPPTVVDLRLGSCGLNSSDIAILCDYLSPATTTQQQQPNQTIQRLSLDKNDFGAKGARLIGEMLLKNTTLLLLDIHDCRLDEHGHGHIATAFQVNQTLQHIILGDARGHAKQYKDLCRLLAPNLRQNVGLVTLEFCNLNIAIQQSKRTTGTTTTTISATSMPDVCLEFFTNVLQQNFTLQHVKSRKAPFFELNEVKTNLTKLSKQNESILQNEPGRADFGGILAWKQVQWWLACNQCGARPLIENKTQSLADNNVSSNDSAQRQRQEQERQQQKQEQGQQPVATSVWIQALSESAKLATSQQFGIDFCFELLTANPAMCSRA